MKNYQSIITLIFFMFLATIANAQTTPAAPVPNYFEGKWNVFIKGTPNGDVTLPMRFEQKEGKFSGFYTNPETKEEVAMTSVEVKGDDINLAFTIMSYDVTATLTKKDDDHANGKLMDMFEAEGTKVK